MSDPQAEEIYNQLQQPDESGESVADRLSEVLLKLAETRPTNAHENFELYLKKERRMPPPPQDPEHPAPECEDPNILSGMRKEALQKGQEIFKIEPPSEDAPPPDVRFVSTLDEAYHFNEMGVGLGQEEFVEILMHMKNFFSKNGARGVRFFGKIFGIEKNYYIVESTPSGEMEEEDANEAAEEAGGEENIQAEEAEEAKEEEEEGEEAPGEPTIEPDPDEPQIQPPEPPKDAEELPKEERKKYSPNQYVYWVCTGITDPWHRLPDVTPSMLMAARVLSRAFTGNLAAPVTGSALSTLSPPPPALKERHLLRAQIARISHSTTLTPRPPQKKAGEGGEEEEEQAEEEGEGGGADFTSELKKDTDMAALLKESGWLHARPPLLVQGRVEVYPPPPEGGEEEEEGGDGGPTPAQLAAQQAQLQKKKAEFEKNQMMRYEVWQGRDEFEAKPNMNPHKSIEADATAGHPLVHAFTIRSKTVAGETTVLLKSNIWPGAYTIVYPGLVPHIAHIYIGFGKKAQSVAYTLPPPPTLPEEYDDLDEQIDPTPEEEKALNAQPATEEAAEEAAEEAVEEAEEENE